jgi:SAM-dependent methyltransferase
MNIPQNVDNLIFKLLKGQYNKNTQSVSYNLEAKEEEINWYLGTYYPRSFIEAYETFHSLCKEQIIKDIFQDKKEINILDVGSGTGGYLLGIVNAIRDILGDKEIFAIAIDGNELALQYQKKISELMNDENLLLETMVSNLPRDNFIPRIKEMLSFQGLKYDIIVTSKFISEYFNNPLYGNSYNHVTQGLYKDFLLLAENWLQKDGITIVNDITNGVKNDFRNDSIFIPSLPL